MIIQYHSSILLNFIINFVMIFSNKLLLSLNLLNFYYIEMLKLFIKKLNCLQFIQMFFLFCNDWYFSFVTHVTTYLLILTNFNVRWIYKKILSRKSVLIELVHDNHWHILSIRVFVTMSTDNLINDNFCLSALCIYQEISLKYHLNFYYYYWILQG